jgi:hypothetical protein
VSWPERKYTADAKGRAHKKLVDRYRARRDAGLCTWYNCDRPTTNSCCPEHLKVKAAAAKVYSQRRRARLEAVKASLRTKRAERTPPAVRFTPPAVTATPVVAVVAVGPDGKLEVSAVDKSVVADMLSGGTVAVIRRT